MCFYIDILNAHKPRPIPIANAGRLLILPPDHVMCESPGGCGVFAYNSYHWFPCKLFIFPASVITSAHGFQLGKEYRLVGAGIQSGGAIASVTPNSSRSSSLSRNVLGGKAISTVACGPEGSLQEKHCPNE